MKYTQDHEWIDLDNDIATIGVTDFAQQQLGDIVFIELPNVGEEIDKGQEVVVIESIKAAGEIKTPVSGVIVEVNTSLHDTPEIVNDDPQGQGWLLKIQLSSTVDLTEFMNEDTYRAMVNSDL
jgi:glycine cleavage system H protein